MPLLYHSHRPADPYVRGRRPTPLTEAEHREVGRLLSRIRCGLEVELAAKLYPRRKGGGRGREHWRKASRQVNNLRNRLDGAYCAEFRTASPYYGGIDVPRLDGGPAEYVRARYEELNRVGEIINGHVPAPVIDNHQRALSALSALADVFG